METHQQAQATLEADRIRDHLRELLASDVFAGSAKLSRFLEFTVEQTVAGKGGELKEYRLGVEIYGRPPDYDPRTDPIIRVEARRLRAKLKGYYDARPGDPAVEISYPKGRYAPEFRFHGPTIETPTFTKERSSIGVRLFQIRRVHDSETVAASAAPDPRNSVILGFFNARLWFVFVAITIVGLLYFEYFRTRSGNERSQDFPRVMRISTQPGQDLDPALSPDGLRLAFRSRKPHDGGFSLYVKTIGVDHPPLQLTTGFASDVSPAWSRDGRYIAFLRLSPAAGGFYVVPSVGGQERLVSRAFAVNHDLESRVLDWAPDAHSLAVSDLDAQAETFSLYLLEVEDGMRRKLTSPEPHTRGDFGPTFSPDGRLLAFVRSRARGISDVFVMPAGGGEAQRLTFHSMSIDGITWTRDGREIVYSGDDTGTQRLFRVRASGGKPALVTGVGDNVQLPSISGQHNRLACVQLFKTSSICRAPIGQKSGSSTADKLITSTRWQEGAEFSPDGKRIAFYSNRTGHRELWVCDSSGRHAISLTSFGGSRIGSPRWSPDGTRLVFDSRLRGNSDIYVVNAAGGGLRQITYEPSEELVPSWSRDGRSLYFASNRNGLWQVWRKSVQGGIAVQITNAGGYVSVESVDGRTLYYSKEPGVPGIWNVPVQGGDEMPVPGLKLIRGWGTWSNWVVTWRGIYYLEAGDGAGDLTPKIKLLSFSNGATSIIANLRDPIAASYSGLAVAADEKSALYLTVHQDQRDIVLLDNFQ